MVRLKNIVRDGNTISCDYYPESTDLKGHIVVDIPSRSVIKHIESSYDKGFPIKTYAMYAKLRLLDIVDDNDPVPNETLAMWY